jgi:hypothetical protein
MCGNEEYKQVMAMAKATLVLVAIDGKLPLDLRKDIILAAVHYMTVSTRCDTLMTLLERHSHTGEDKLTLGESLYLMVHVTEELIKKVEVAGEKLRNLIEHATKFGEEKVES